MSLINTIRQEIRVLYPNNVDRDEWRFTRYGALTSIVEQTNGANSIITEDLRQKALISEGTALKIPVFKIGGITITNARSCAIGDLDNTTELVDVVWTTLVADISMKKAGYHNNNITYLQDLNKKITRVQNGFLQAVEQLVITKLETEKSVVYNSPIALNEYTPVGDALQVALSQQDLFFNDLEGIMQGDDFFEAPYQVISSTSLMPTVRHYIQQGASNDENLNYQFGSYSFRFTNGISVPANNKAVGYAMEMGTVGILSRVNVDANMKNKTSDGTEWDTTFLERFGFNVGVMYKSTCDDLSGSPEYAHLKATMVENWQFSIDIALVSQYNSDSANIAGGIKKFMFKTT